MKEPIKEITLPLGTEMPGWMVDIVEAVRVLARDYNQRRGEDTCEHKSVTVLRYGNGVAFENCRDCGVSLPVPQPKSKQKKECCKNCYGFPEVASGSFLCTCACHATACPERDDLEKAKEEMKSEEHDKTMFCNPDGCYFTDTGDASQCPCKCHKREEHDDDRCGSRSICPGKLWACHCSCHSPKKDAKKEIIEELRYIASDTRDAWAKDKIRFVIEKVKDLPLKSND